MTPREWLDKACKDECMDTAIGMCCVGCAVTAIEHAVLEAREGIIACLRRGELPDVMATAICTAVAEEREQCAKVAEAFPAGAHERAKLAIAAEIRARGGK